jgi:hypothetical protein
MKGEREREGIVTGDSWGKRKRGRGVSAKQPPLHPLPRDIQRQGRAAAGGLGRRRPAGLPATEADGERGKRRRATRGFVPLTHLGSRRREGAAPRAAADRW